MRLWHLQNSCMPICVIWCLKRWKVIVDAKFYVASAELKIWLLLTSLQMMWFLNCTMPTMSVFIYCQPFSVPSFPFSLHHCHLFILCFIPNLHSVFTDSFFPRCLIFLPWKWWKQVPSNYLSNYMVSHFRKQ